MGLYKHLIAIAKELKQQSSRVLWKEIVAAAEAYPLNASLQNEAQKIGLKKAAKWAARAATASDEQATLFDEWADGSLPDPEGARIARTTADIAAYDWQINSLNKAIAGFIRSRDRLVKERDALIAEGKSQ